MTAAYRLDDWETILPNVTFVLNDSISHSTGFTPFFLVYGQHPNTLAVDAERPHSETLSQRNRSLENAALALKTAHEYQSKSYDKHHNPSNIAVGDHALILRDGIQWAGDSQRPRVLLSKWLGPFRVLERHGNNITVELPTSTKIHNVFSVNKAKLYQSRPNHTTPVADLIDGAE